MPREPAPHPGPARATPSDTATPPAPVPPSGSPKQPPDDGAQPAAPRWHIRTDPPPV